MTLIVNRKTVDVRYVDGQTLQNVDPNLWLIDPDISAVKNKPIQHWALDKDENLVLKSREETKAIDARVKKKMQDGMMDRFKTDKVLQAMLATALEEINILRAAVNLPEKTIHEFRVSIRNKL